MRGSPPVQLALLLIGFFVVGVPLVQLTHGRSETRAQAAAKAPHTESKAIFIRVKYAHPPAKLRLVQGEQELPLLPGATPSTFECRPAIALPDRALELSVLAEWPAGTPDTVLTVEVEPDQLEGRSHTLWSTDGRIEDTLSFTWN